MAEEKAEGHEDHVAFFAGSFTELELDRTTVEVFQKEDSVQSVLRKVRGLLGGLQRLLPVSNIDYIFWIIGEVSTLKYNHLSKVPYFPKKRRFSTQNPF